MKIIQIIFLTVLFSSILSNAQTVSSGKASFHLNNKQSSIKKPSESLQSSSVNVKPEQIIQGKYYGLIIGINDYTDPLITSLDRPVYDAESFYNTILARYTFETENVRLLRNATYADIVESLDYFSKTVQEEDNFLIFYAGHGFWDKSSGIGSWLPSDARKESKTAWFRNSALRDYLREIKSRHTLVISDACFAGSIFKTRSAFNEYNLAIDKLYELPSRKAMTSGTLTEVPDQSAFLKYLNDRLLQNENKFITSEELYSSFRMAVINNSKAIPQFGVIQEVGDEGGDFIFVRRDLF